MASASASASLSVIAFAFLASPLAAQEVLHVIEGEGFQVEAAGDVDADGATDFVIGSTAGFSGRTGKLLFRRYLEGPDYVPDAVHAVDDLDGDGASELWLGLALYSGASLLADGGRFRPPVVLAGISYPVPNFGPLGGTAPLDDLDGDGIPEILSGWPDISVRRCPSDHPAFSSGGSGGSASIQNGLGTTLHGWTGAGPSDAFGGVVARLGDLDGDGFDDVAVGTRVIPQTLTLFCQFGGAGQLEVFSAASGTLLWELEDAPRSIAPTVDIDRDGVRDVALGFPYAGEVELRSGATGALLRTLDDGALGSGVHLFGYQVVPFDDLDGDGGAELLVSAPDPLIFPIGVPGNPFSAGPGRVLIVSPASGRLLATLTGASTGLEFGSDVAVLGDVNGDGHPEIAVSSARIGAWGHVQVITVKSGSLPAARAALGARRAR